MTRIFCHCNMFQLIYWYLKLLAGEFWKQWKNNHQCRVAHAWHKRHSSHQVLGDAAVRNAISLASSVADTISYPPSQTLKKPSDDRSTTAVAHSSSAERLLCHHMPRYLQPLSWKRFLAWNINYIYINTGHCFSCFLWPEVITRIQLTKVVSKQRKNRSRWWTQS